MPSSEVCRAIAMSMGSGALPRVGSIQCAITAVSHDSFALGPLVGNRTMTGDESSRLLATAPAPAAQITSPSSSNFKEHLPRIARRTGGAISVDDCASESLVAIMSHRAQNRIAPAPPTGSLPRRHSKPTTWPLSSSVPQLISSIATLIQRPFRISFDLVLVTQQLFAFTQRTRTK